MSQQRWSAILLGLMFSCQPLTPFGFDARSTDGGGTDAGPFDSGPVGVDAGRDPGRPDASLGDAGLGDAGSGDAGHGFLFTKLLTEPSVTCFSTIAGYSSSRVLLGSAQGIFLFTGSPAAQLLNATPVTSSARLGQNVYFSAEDAGVLNCLNCNVGDTVVSAGLSEQTHAVCSNEAELFAVTTPLGLPDSNTALTRLSGPVWARFFYGTNVLRGTGCAVGPNAAFFVGSQTTRTYLFLPDGGLDPRNDAVSLPQVSTDDLNFTAAAPIANRFVVGSSTGLIALRSTTGAFSVLGAASGGPVLMFAAVEPDRLIAVTGDGPLPLQTVTLSGVSAFEGPPELTTRSIWALDPDHLYFAGCRANQGELWLGAR